MESLAKDKVGPRSSGVIRLGGLANFQPRVIH